MSTLECRLTRDDAQACIDLGRWQHEDVLLSCTTQKERKCAGACMVRTSVCLCTCCQPMHRVGRSCMLSEVISAVSPSFRVLLW